MGNTELLNSRVSVTKVNTDVSKSSMNQPALSKKKKKTHPHAATVDFFYLLETLSVIQTCEKFSTLLQEWAEYVKSLK